MLSGYYGFALMQQSSLPNLDLCRAACGVPLAPGTTENQEECKQCTICPPGKMATPCRNDADRTCAGEVDFSGLAFSDKTSDGISQFMREGAGSGLGGFQAVGTGNPGIKTENDDLLISSGKGRSVFIDNLDVGQAAFNLQNDIKSLVSMQKVCWELCQARLAAKVVL